MTIAFLALRKGFLKVTGALVAAAVARGHDVVLLWDPVEPKPGERVAREDLAPWSKARVLQVDRRAPLLPVLDGAGVRALVGPSLFSALRAFGHEDELVALRAAGVRLYSVDYGLDTVTSAPDGYRAIDKTFYGSEEQRTLHWRVKADEFRSLGDRAALEARSAVCGSTMLDQLAVVDRAAVRVRYGLPPTGPIVLLMSLKMAVPDPWRRLVWASGPRLVRAVRALATGHAGFIPEIVRGGGYRAFADALRRFCDRHGATLVVKSREKNADPAFLRRLGDVFVHDERIYPYTSMELMAVADLCVHFQSAAVIEAAFASVGSLSVVVSQSHLRRFPSFEEFYGARPDSLQNYPGVVWSVAAADAAGLLARARLSDFCVDPERRRQYVRRFNGFDDMRASERVLDVIERAA